jgi:hypothetical protein
MYMPASALFQLAFAAFPTIGHPSFSVLFCYLVAVQTSLDFPTGSAWSVLMFPAPIVIGLPFVWADTFEVTRLSTTPAF